MGREYGKWWGGGIGGGGGIEHCGVEIRDKVKVGEVKVVKGQKFQHQHKIREQSLQDTGLGGFLSRFACWYRSRAASEFCQGFLYFINLQQQQHACTKISLNKPKSISSSKQTLSL